MLETFTGKKLQELRNEFLQMFGETSLNKLLLIPKNIFYMVSVKKLIDKNSY